MPPPSPRPSEEYRWQAQEADVLYLNTEGGNLRQLMRATTDQLQIRNDTCVPKDIFDHLEDAILVFDAEWQVFFLNKAAERLFPENCDVCCGRQIWTELASLAGESFESACRQAMLDQQARELELPHCSAGTWFEFRLFPSREGLTIQVRDVTARKRVELARIDREKWFSTLVNTVGGIVWVADAETIQFSFVSKQAEKVLGYPAERWINEPTFWSDHLHPEDAKWCTEFCAEASRQRRDHEFEYRMIAADGRVVWLRDIVTVTVEEDGAARLRGIMVDVTAQKELEERLLQKEEHFRRLVENAWDCILIVTDQGMIQYSSSAIERLLGYKPEEMLGTCVFNWIAPEDTERVGELFQSVFTDNVAGIPIAFHSRHKDGSVRTLESIGKRYLDEAGRMVAVINTRDITDRNRIETQLRESETRFRLLFERNAAGMAIIGLENQLIQVNSAFCRMLGYSEEELLQKTILEITHPDDREVTQRVQEDLRKGRCSVIDLEKRYIHKDGRMIWAHISAIFVSAENRPAYTVVTIQDITDRQMAAEALRISEQRYRSLVLASSQVVWLTNDAGEAIPGQPSWGALTGQSEEEICGHGWLDAVHPDDRKQAQRRWLDAITTRKYYQAEFRIRTVQNGYRDFSVRGVPVLAADGSIREWVGTCTDITEQKRAAADILTWKNRYETAIETSGQLLIEWSPSNKELTYHGNLEGLLGYSAAEMAGGLDRWIELVHPEDLLEFKRHLDHTFRAHEPFDLEYRIKHRDGSYRTVSGRGRFYRYPGEDSDRMIGLVSDITELSNSLLQLARAKEAAEEASYAKDEFLAALSHELRTPLNPVLMLTSELENSPEIPPSVREDFSMIRKNVELEARMIDDLLDITRITRGKLQLNLRTVESHTVIHQAIEIVQNEMEAKQQRLVMELSAPDHRLHGDPVRLQQVFWNVLRNAVKFTPPGGTITIRSSNTPGRKLLIEFRDTGMGIAAEDLNHIFEPFLQGKADGQHQFGGLGLGLAISRQVVELHQGRIWAESMGSGAGSAFFIELPLAAAEVAEKKSKPPQVAVPAPGATGSRILLVEDHEPTRLTLARLLTRRGYRVSCADSVAAAKDLAAHDQFDLVTSDIGLPDGSGHELMSELHRDYHLTGIALSGYGMEEDIQRSLASGFATHLTKPVDMESLLHAIHDLEEHPVA